MKRCGLGSNPFDEMKSSETDSNRTDRVRLRTFHIVKHCNWPLCRCTIELHQRILLSRLRTALALRQIHAWCPRRARVFSANFLGGRSAGRICQTSCFAVAAPLPTCRDNLTVPALLPLAWLPFTSGFASTSCCSSSASSSCATSSLLLHLPPPAHRTWIHLPDLHLPTCRPQ